MNESTEIELTEIESTELESTEIESTELVSNEKVEWKSLNSPEFCNSVFFVPAYQRGLRWKKEEMKHLIDDLEEFYDDKNQMVYSLQPITLKKIDSTNERLSEKYQDLIQNKDCNIYEVIDGQQRLTVIWLIQKIKKYILGEFFNAISDGGVHYDFDYSLIFEGKNDYNKLIGMINEDFYFDKEIHSINDVKEKIIDIEKRDSKFKKDIDCQHLIKLVEYLTDNELNFRSKSYEKIFRYKDKDAQKSYEFIWHELADNNDKAIIDKFTKINANHISLTDAELIKAIIFKPFPKGHRIESFSAQWESIERSLGDDDFWCFFNSSKNIYKYPSRISFLLEVYKYCQVDENNSKEEDLIFWYKKQVKYIIDNTPVEKNVDKEEKIAEEVEKKLWYQIVQIHDSLKDWYEDYEMYHAIGLLTEIDESMDTEELIKTYYKKYISSTKDKFKKYLKERIRECSKEFLLEKNENGDFDAWPENETGLIFDNIEKKDIRTEEVDENAKGKYVKPLMLLFDVSLLVNTYNNNGKLEVQRFPFRYYKENRKKAKIDEEHINAASFEYKDVNEYKKLETDKEKIEQMIEVIVMLEDDEWPEKMNQVREMCYKIDEGIEKELDPDDLDVNKLIGDNIFIKKDKKNAFFKLLNETYKNAPLGCVWNLTLLEKELNISVKNNNFLEKRKKVLAAHYGFEIPGKPGEHYKDSIVFPGAQMIFNRQILADERLDAIRWTSVDGKKYLEQIQRSIFDYLIKDIGADHDGI